MFLICFLSLTNSTSNHMFKSKIWDKFTEFTFFKFWNLPSETCESLQHVINQESHVYLWNLRKIYLVHFSKLWNLHRFTREILKFPQSELGQFISNFPVKHVINSAN